ncbi:MAG: NAD(P)/FAD-dependent oxidoreductase [Sphingomonadales bacterium]|nr:NAD(P)/FAD-dependent oxidoreductase [Sphingomonadales bacterium]
MAGPFTTDAIVVGAGAVGLACARALARRGDEVIVLEARDAFGQGISSRNSEVLHAGIYYPTGSLKARLCVAGNRLIREYCALHGIALDPCGKLVVATASGEEPALAAIAAQAAANAVPATRMLTGAEARGLEPRLVASAALHCPTSAVFDSHGYMTALLGEIEDHGGRLAVATPFLSAEVTRQGFRLRCGGAEPVTIACQRLVLAPGLGAQEAARAIDGFPPALIPARHLAKGSYFALNAPAPFSRLVYPLPVPGSLGTHYRRDLGGQPLFGPDLEWIDHEDYTPSASHRDRFAAAIRRYWPALDPQALTPAYAGIRPKIHGPGEPQPDFDVCLAERHGLPGLAALFGIESPGLTASLALGDHVARQLAEG